MTGGTGRNGISTRLAVEEMLSRTSTRKAPWTVVESNDKYYSRMKVLKTVIEPPRGPWTDGWRRCGSDEKVVARCRTVNR